MATPKPDPNVYTLNLGGPCIKWKLVLTVKNQNGWPGFVPPYYTRYLQQDVSITQTPALGYGTPSQAPGTTRTGSFAIDRWSGLISAISGNASASFPYGETPTDYGNDPTQGGYQRYTI